MEISRKTDYALRMLSELVRQSESVVSVRTAAEANNIPYSFARAIQHDLTVSGIIESVRGAHGGMKLAVDPKKTTMLAVIEAVQGTIRFVDCDECDDDASACSCLASCGFVPVWRNGARILRAYFESITLYDIVVEGLMPDIDPVFSVVPARG